jgi:magnesium transporter
MINVLLLPELREMLANDDQDELQQFCTALNPARTAEFMEGLTDAEAWAVLRATSESRRAEIFQYFEHPRQLAILNDQDPAEVALLIGELYADDRVDLLQEMDVERVNLLLELLPKSDRRDIQRLQAYPEGTAGAMMTTEMAKLAEHLSVREALNELGRLSEKLETIYYIYVVNDDDQLRGVVSGRQLISALGKGHTTLADLMVTDIAAVNVTDHREAVAQKVEKFDLLAIPVVEESGRLVGIITHDDVIDVVREEMIEDVQRINAIAPLRDEYLRINLMLLSWKRGVWLVVLFFTALLTAFSLRHYSYALERYGWLVLFLPLISSTGGNSGNQAATLVITALASNELTERDWKRVLLREWLLGLMLGGILSTIGFLVAWQWFAPSAREALIVPITLMIVVIFGCSTGSMLPLFFRKLGLDPALMANPFIAGIMDITGIVIYLNIALMMIR